MLATWILVGGFLLGAACGGLATILIARIPDRGNLMARPKCPDCENRIAWRDLVPIISWLLLRGRCRVCGATIDWTFPVTEIASGGLFVTPMVLFAATTMHFLGVTAPSAGALVASKIIT